MTHAKNVLDSFMPINGAIRRVPTMSTRAMPHPITKKWHTENSRKANTPMPIINCRRLYAPSDEPLNVADTAIVIPRSRANKQ